MDFWTFGDSFASTTTESTDWFSILTKNILAKKYFNLFCDARDTQTIMDSFYRNLCNIPNDSFVIIWLPSLARIRYPKHSDYFSKMLEASFTTNGKFFDLNHIENEDGFDIIEHFTHFPYFDYPNGKGRPELDFPFNHFDYNKINSEYVSYTFHSDKDTQQEFKRVINEEIDNIKPIDFYKLIQVSEASVENWDNIFTSLKSFCNFEILFVSWTDEYKSNNVIGRKQLTEEIGFWHTKHEEFLETNGKKGIEWDEHFSTKMNKAFSEWVIKKYPKYFKI